VMWTLQREPFRSINMPVSSDAVLSHGGLYRALIVHLSIQVDIGKSKCSSVTVVIMPLLSLNVNNILGPLFMGVVFSSMCVMTLTLRLNE
jgi:hypothetical protein